ncbi:hypothetical protein IG631_10354 [Alternaria alternata]|nr:hypothetical protein IG631_10354 [Alternaria alternata]
MTAPATAAKPRPLLSTVVCPKLGRAHRVRTALHNIPTNLPERSTIELSDVIRGEEKSRLQVAQNPVPRRRGHWYNRMGGSPIPRSQRIIERTLQDQRYWKMRQAS